jgi:hypothetical protein
VKRTYVGEMEWALQQVNARNGDRNPNRQAQVSAAVEYGLKVGVARRGRMPLPERPDLDRAV